MTPRRFGRPIGSTPASTAGRKVLRSVRLDPELDAALVALGGSVSAHVEAAVGAWLAARVQR